MYGPVPEPRHRSPARLRGGRRDRQLHPRRRAPGARAVGGLHAGQAPGEGRRPAPVRPEQAPGRAVEGRRGAARLCPAHAGAQPGGAQRPRPKRGGGHGPPRLDGHRGLFPARHPGALRPRLSAGPARGPLRPQLAPARCLGRGRARPGAGHPARRSHGRPAATPRALDLGLGARPGGPRNGPNTARGLRPGLRLPRRGHGRLGHGGARLARGLQQHQRGRGPGPRP